MTNHVLCDFHQRWIAHHAEKSGQSFDSTIQMLFDLAEIYHTKMMKSGREQEMVRELSALNLRRMNPRKR